jgi:hypothetical protein
MVGIDESADGAKALQASMVFIFIRYVGNACGLIIAGVIFQHQLRDNLALNTSERRARPRGKKVLILATERSLERVWTVMFVCSLFVLFLCCFTVLPTVEQERHEGVNETIPPVEQGGV